MRLSPQTYRVGRGGGRAPVRQVRDAAASFYLDFKPHLRVNRAGDTIVPCLRKLDLDALADPLLAGVEAEVLAINEHVVNELIVVANAQGVAECELHRVRQEHAVSLRHGRLGAKGEADPDRACQE